MGQGDHLNATTKTVILYLCGSKFCSLQATPCTYVPFTDHPAMIQIHSIISTMPLQLYSTNLVIAGNFNMPDITWIEGYGQVHPSPLYGTTVNYSLLDLASDNHLEQLIHENT